MQSQPSCGLTHTEADKLAFSIKEAARASCISRSELYLASARGDLRAVKLGKRTLIRREDLVAFLAGLPTMGKAA